MWNIEVDMGAGWVIEDDEVVYCEKPTAEHVAEIGALYGRPVRVVEVTEGAGR